MISIGWHWLNRALKGKWNFTPHGKRETPLGQTGKGKAAGTPFEVHFPLTAQLGLAEQVAVKTADGKTTGERRPRHSKALKTLLSHSPFGMGSPPQPPIHIRICICICSRLVACCSTLGTPNFADWLPLAHASLNLQTGCLLLGCNNICRPVVSSSCLPKFADWLPVVRASQSANVGTPQQQATSVQT